MYVCPPWRVGNLNSFVYIINEYVSHRSMVFLKQFSFPPHFNWVFGPTRKPVRDFKFHVIDIRGKKKSPQSLPTVTIHPSITRPTHLTPSWLPKNVPEQVQIRQLSHQSLNLRNLLANCYRAKKSEQITSLRSVPAQTKISPKQSWSCLGTKTASGDTRGVW